MENFSLSCGEYSGNDSSRIHTQQLAANCRTEANISSRISDGTGQQRGEGRGGVHITNHKIKLPTQAKKGK